MTDEVIDDLEVWREKWRKASPLGKKMIEKIVVKIKEHQDLTNQIKKFEEVTEVYGKAQ